MSNAPSMKHTAPRLELVQKAAGLAALAAFTLTACTANDEPADTNQGAAESPDTETPADGQTDDTDDDTTQTGTDAGDEQPSAGPVDPDDALETVSYEIPAEDVDGTITVGFHHLQAEGETMELLLTFTPEFEQHEAYTLWQLHSQTHALVEPALYDRENLKRYAVLRSGSNQESIWSTHGHAVELTSGDTQGYWANYAAPQDDIDTISVGLPSGPEFKDVEIQQGFGNVETPEDGE